MLQIILLTTLWSAFALGLFLLGAVLLLYWQGRHNEDQTHRGLKVIEAIGMTLTYMSFTCLTIYRAIFSIYYDWMAQDSYMTRSVTSLVKIGIGILLIMGLNEFILRHFATPWRYTKEIILTEKTLIAILGCLLVFTIIIRGAILGRIGGYIV